MNKLVNEIKQVSIAFKQSISQHLPALKQVVWHLIKSKSKNESEIENMLDTLLSLTMHGIGDELYIKLLDYYKKVSPEGAEYYWDAYNEQE